MGIIRTLLAISVVLSHFPSAFLPALYPGDIAVELFFIISGFYMALVLSGRYDRSTLNGVTSFYVSRFFRLWPVYILTVAAVQLFALVSVFYLGRPTTAAAPFREWIGNDALWALFNFFNIFMIGADIGSNMHVSEQGVRLTLLDVKPLSDGSISLAYMNDVGQAWSIGLEIWFYLLAPFLVGVSNLGLILIAAVSLLIRIVIYAQGHQAYFFFPAQLVMFIIGILAYRVSRAGRLGGREAAYACVGVLVLGLLVFNSAVGTDWRFKWIFYGAFALSLGALFNATANWKRDRFIGELSYPIYIMHLFVGVLVAEVVKIYGGRVTAEWVLLVVLPLSLVVYRFVEKPISEWRGRFVFQAGVRPKVVAA